MSASKTHGKPVPFRTVLIAGTLVLSLTALGLWIYLAKGRSSELGYTDVEPNAAVGMMNQYDNLVILDVREQYEYEAEHIPGSVLIPLNQLYSGGYKELDQDTPILVVCRSGRRSAQASEFLVKQGFSSVYNLLGGILEWPGPTEGN